MFTVISISAGAVVFLVTWIGKKGKSQSKGFTDYYAAKRYKKKMEERSKQPCSKISNVRWFVLIGCLLGIYFLIFTLIKNGTNL